MRQGFHLNLSLEKSRDCIVLTDIEIHKGLISEFKVLDGRDSDTFVCWMFGFRFAKQGEKFWEQGKHSGPKNFRKRVKKANLSEFKQRIEVSKGSRNMPKISWNLTPEYVTNRVVSGGRGGWHLYFSNNFSFSSLLPWSFDALPSSVCIFTGYLAKKATHQRRLFVTFNTLSLTPARTILEFESVRPKCATCTLSRICIFSSASAGSLDLLERIFQSRRERNII